jgi:hypothetical protein
LRPDIPPMASGTTAPVATPDDGEDAASPIPAKVAATADKPDLKFPAFPTLASMPGAGSILAAAEPADVDAFLLDQLDLQNGNRLGKTASPPLSMPGQVQTTPPAVLTVADLQMPSEDMSSLIDAMIVHSHTGTLGEVDNLAKAEPSVIKADASQEVGDATIDTDPDAKVTKVAVGRVETTPSAPDVDHRARMAGGGGETVEKSGGGITVESRLTRELTNSLDRLGGQSHQVSAPVMESMLGGAILNAAMIPGWPPPRPFANAIAKQLLSGEPGQAEESLLEVLKSLGVGKKLMDRLRDKLRQIRRKLEALINLGVLYATVMSVMESVADELQALADEEEDEIRASSFGGRQRIPDR